MPLQEEQKENLLLVIRFYVGKLFLTCPMSSKQDCPNFYLSVHQAAIYKFVRGYKD